jgi:hypothetical protein
MITASNRAPGKYETLAADLGKTVDAKQKAYGYSFAKSGRVLSLLYPDGVRPEQFQDMLAVTRIIDKLFRIATEPEAFDEDPWLDIAGYGLLGYQTVRESKDTFRQKGAGGRWWFEETREASADDAQ